MDSAGSVPHINTVPTCGAPFEKPLKFANKNRPAIAMNPKIPMMITWNGFKVGILRRGKDYGVMMRPGSEILHLMEACTDEQLFGDML